MGSSFSLLHALLLVATFALTVAPRSRAADDSVLFVEALRQRGEYDLAIEFLNRAEENPTASEAFRQRLAFERFATRLDQARARATSPMRKEAIASARRDIEQLIQSSPDKAIAAEASAKLATVILDDAKSDLALASNKAGAERTKSLQTIRQAMDEARSRFLQAEKGCVEALKRFKAVVPGSPEAARRLKLRGELAQVRLRAAQTLFEKARTYSQRSKSAKQNYEEAAQQLGDLYDKYEPWPIGFYAHLYEGRCYQAIGEFKLSDDCYDTLIELPSQELAFRSIVTLAHAHLISSFIEQKRPQQALAIGRRRLDSLKTLDSTSPDVLALKHQLGEAARLSGEASEAPGETRRLLQQARSLLRDASQGVHDRQRESRASLTRVNELLGSTAANARNFAEAYLHGKDAMDGMNAARLAAKLAGKNNPDALEDLTEQLVHSREDAREAFVLALSLVDDTAELAQVNEVRYLLSWLYWEEGDYLRAAAIGEFLATHYPDDPSAEAAAKLAMASMERLYQTAAKDPLQDARFEADMLAQLSEFVTRRWAGTPTADVAFGVLLSVALRDHRLDEAKRALEGIAPERRAPLEIKLANAQWEQAIRAAASATEDRRDAAEQTKRQAADYLRRAFERARHHQPFTSSMATASLYRAQSLLDEENALQAIQTLEDEATGPLALIARKAPAVGRPGFVIETLKTALRAYVSVVPLRLDDAVATMNRLDKAIGVGDPKATLRIYFSLGAQLQRQIERLESEGKHDEAQRVTSAFAKFVDRIDDIAGESDWVTRQWMAQTYMKLGDSLADAPDDGQTSRGYYQKAVALFQDMIDQAAESDSFAPLATSVLAARMQLGQAQRKQGDFKAAIETFHSILLERQAMLDVQKAVAYAYQAWGETDTSHFETAIRGGGPLDAKGKNLVWGWSKMAKIAARAARSQPKHRDLFFESWLNVATCRYLAGMKSSGVERSRQLASAKKTILLLSKQYPELGGEERRSQFDRLLRQVQKANNEKPTGLDSRR